MENTVRLKIWHVIQKLQQGMLSELIKYLHVRHLMITVQFSRLKYTIRKMAVSFLIRESEYKM